MKGLLFVVVLIAGFVTSAFAQARPTLGVLPFTGGAEGEGDVIASLFLNQRELRDVFNVVPRNLALNTIFREQQFQMSDLADPDTITSINRLLNADYVLAGSITRLGDRNLLIASIIHVENFEQVAGTHVTYRNIEEVIGLLSGMSRNLVDATNTASRRTANLPSLAIAPFAHRAGVSAYDAETLAQLLAIEILNTGGYVVLPRLSVIQAALREQGFQMDGFTDDAGMASLGRAMNANHVLSGSITRLGATNMFMAQILNAEDGRVIEGDQVQYQTITDGIDLMAELAVLLTFPPGQQRDWQIMRLRLGLRHPVNVPGATLSDQLAWLRTNAANDTAYLIQLNGNATIAPNTLTLPAGRSNVTIAIRGAGAMRAVSLSANGSLFTVSSGVTLVLDENIALRGRNPNTNYLVRIDNGGILIMGAGSEITGNIGRGAVIVNTGGAFTMFGGTISGNTGSNGNGGNHSTVVASNGVHGEMHRMGFNGGSGGTGVHGGMGGTGGVRNMGTFIMLGGIISGNRGGNGGAGGNGSWGGAGGGSLISHGGMGGTGGDGGHGGMGGTGGVHNTGTFTIHYGIVSGNFGGAGGLGGTGGRGGVGGTSGNRNSLGGQGGRGGSGGEHGSLGQVGGRAGMGGMGGTAPRGSNGNDNLHNAGMVQRHGGTISSNCSGADVQVVDNRESIFGNVSGSLIFYGNSLVQYDATNVTGMGLSLDALALPTHHENGKRHFVIGSIRWE